MVLGEAALEVDVEVVAAFLPLFHVSVLHGCGGSGELRPARGSGEAKEEVEAMEASITLVPVKMKKLLFRASLWLKATIPFFIRSIFRMKF